MSHNLRSSLIRLANTNPKLRPHLLPLLVEKTAGRWEDEDNDRREEEARRLWKDKGIASPELMETFRQLKEEELILAEAVSMAIQKTVKSSFFFKLLKNASAMAQAEDLEQPAKDLRTYLFILNGIKFQADGFFRSLTKDARKDAPF